LIVIERDISIGDVEVERTVVIEVTELPTKTPATEFHAHVTREVFILQCVSCSTFLRHPQIVSLDQHTIFRDIRDIDGHVSTIKHIAEGNVHPALGRESNACLLTYL